MNINLIDKINDEFKAMTFLEKSMFLKDYKQRIELLPNYITYYIDTNHKGIRNSLIKEIITIIPPKHQLDLRTYYTKISKKNSYESYDLLLIVALGKILNNKDLVEKTYKLIVFIQKNTIWTDCAKLGLTKNHFKNFWIFHNNGKSLYKLVRKHEEWPYLIDLICDIYSFYNYIINYHPSFKETFMNQPEPEGLKDEDYLIPGLKLDPYKYNIEFV